MRSEVSPILPAVATSRAIPHRFQGSFDLVEGVTIFLESAQLFGHVLAFRFCFFQSIFQGRFVLLQHFQLGVERLGLGIALGESLWR